MTPTDLRYESLKGTLAPYVSKGRTESASFLDWFLESIYRLDDVAADDAICDSSNDKGIDGVWVDVVNEDVHFFQSKVRQKEPSSLGDTELKEFAGTLEQFKTPEGIEKILEGGANPELKKLIKRCNVRKILEDDYDVSGVFVSNHDPDTGAIEFLEHRPDIQVYGRTRIAGEFIDIDLAAGVTGAATLSCDVVEPLEYTAGQAGRLYLFPAQADELVALAGIEDASLFAQNVRLALGNTKVNKDIQATVSDKTNHIKFPLFHNGITILCNKAEKNNGKLTLHDYVVVNGAQSLTVLFKNKGKISNDLRILVRIVELGGDAELARQITLISNNQNAIKPRDLRSNDRIQMRLKAEFDGFDYDNYAFEVKRGEELGDRNIISNEEAGRLLLAFDLSEPWACHQIYKVFDEKYADIFGRPDVTAARIILLRLIMGVIERNVEKIKNRPFGHYTLTKFFLLSIVSRVMGLDHYTVAVKKNPESILGNNVELEAFLEAIDKLVGGLIVDLNYEVNEEGEVFDYKAELKSPVRVEKRSDNLLKTYEKDVARGKAIEIGKEVAQSIKAKT